MSVVLEIHLVVAFLLALCALVFSWEMRGRRVVNAVAGLQFVLGLVVAGMFGASHQPLPPQLWLHIVIALLILAAYGMAVRLGKRAGGASASLIASIVGILLVFTNIYIGMHMYGRM